MAVSILLWTQRLSAIRAIYHVDIHETYENYHHRHLFDVGRWRGSRITGRVTCWMYRKTIGKDDTKVSRVWVLYKDWLYRKKISKKFWRAKMGRGCWRYRRPIERDDSREWLVWPWYRFWQYRRKFGSRKCVKNQGILRVLMNEAFRRAF